MSSPNLGVVNWSQTYSTFLIRSRYLVPSSDVDGRIVDEREHLLLILLWQKVISSYNNVYHWPTFAEGILSQ